jgi:hypothetical protein
LREECWRKDQPEILRSGGIDSQIVPRRVLDRQVARFCAFEDLIDVTCRHPERQMKQFKSAGQAQRFLSAHDQINNLFHFRRDHVTAAEHRASRTQNFQVWAEICNMGWQ